MVFKVSNEEVEPKMRTVHKRVTRMKVEMVSGSRFERERRKKEKKNE